MTRSEAERRARELQESHPERGRYRFVAREVAGPRPSPADDPRSGHERRVPGVAGGL